MKRNIFLLFAFSVFAITAGESCKSKKQPTQQNQTESVEISTDQQLRTSVDNIVKDYSDVKADINDGVVTLRGSIKQDELQNLIMRVQELKPKKVENQLIIK